MDAPFSRRYLIVDAAIVALVTVVVLILVALSGGGGRGPRPDVIVAVSTADPGQPVPDGFLGLSIEYSSVEPYAGTDPGAPNPLFVRLVRDLTPGGRPVFRIGGDSADWTWWPVPGMQKPPGVSFTLTSQWLHVTRALTSALGAKLILGINLEAGSSQLAATEAAQLVDGLGRGAIRALELGNEPELYGRFAWYRTADGHAVTGRPAGYDFSSFLTDYANFASVLPSLPLAGPTFGSFSWISDLPGFLSAQRSRLGLVTLHRYPLQECFERPGASRYPSIANLMAGRSSRGLAAIFEPYAAIAHAHGLRLRLDELNTVSCGAAPAVSQSFASALWTIDALFALVRAGIDGINIHTFPGAGYELFRFRHGTGGWEARIAPQYYGLLMFATAAPPGSRLAAVSQSNGSVRTWATVAPGGAVRVVLINPDPRRRHVVAVTLPGRSGSAALERLRAPSLASSTGVTLDDHSFDATASLTRHPDKISATGRGRYVVTLPPASAALLTVY